MWSLFRSLIDRVKVLLAIRAVQELEEEALAASEGRLAGLRRLAAGCEAEGLPEVAADLLKKANTLESVSTPALPPVTQPMSSPPAMLPAMPSGRGKRRG